MIQMMIQICTMKASMMYGIDPSLINSIIKTESNFTVNKVSKTHDHGLMQLNKKPVYDICENIKLGTSHLSDCKKAYEKKLGDGWIVCYNTGVRGASRLTKRAATRHPYYQKVRRNYVSDKIQKTFPFKYLPQQLNDGQQRGDFLSGNHI